jgi:hypothetical protein
MLGRGIVRQGRTVLERELEDRVAKLERALRLARGILRRDDQRNADADRIIDNALDNKP